MGSVANSSWISSSFIDRIAEELDLDNASHDKKAKILEVMESLTRRKGQDGLNSGQNGAAMLTMIIEEWESKR